MFVFNRAISFNVNISFLTVAFFLIAAAPMMILRALAIPVSYPSGSLNDTMSSLNLTRRGDGGMHHGYCTWYFSAVAAGACGNTIPNENKGIALAVDEWQPNLSLCGRTVTITNIANGKTISGVPVVDRCAGCEQHLNTMGNPKNNCDLTPATFAAIADQNDGHIMTTWKFE